MALAKNRNAEAKEELKLALASEKTSFLGAEQARKILKELEILVITQ
jgi:hypothetical protein